MQSPQTSTRGHANYDTVAFVMQTGLKLTIEPRITFTFDPLASTSPADTNMHQSQFYVVLETKSSASALAK